MSCPLYLSYLILQVRGYTSLLRMGQLKLRKVTQPLQSFTANKCQTRLLNWGYLLPKPGLYTSGLNHLPPARKWAANHRNFDSLFALGPPSSQSGIPLLLFQLVGTFHTWSTLCTHSDYPGSGLLFHLLDIGYFLDVPFPTHIPLLFTPTTHTYSLLPD